MRMSRTSPASAVGLSGMTIRANPPRGHTGRKPPETNVTLGRETTYYWFNGYSRRFHPPVTRVATAALARCPFRWRSPGLGSHEHCLRSDASDGGRRVVEGALR